MHHLLKSLETGSNLSMSNLSILVFKLAKFVFNAKLEHQHVEYF